MRIAVDAQLALGTATGIGEYVTGLIAGLRARGLEVAALAQPRLDPWRFDRRVLWDQVVLPALANRSGSDLLHCASGTMPLLWRGPSVVTVHDVAWLRSQAHTRPYARYYFGAFSLARYAHARRIVVDSEFSRSELLGFIPTPPQQVSVVYPGVASDYCTLVRRPDADPFILCVGTVEPRKNLAVIIRALPHVGPQMRLVVAGPSTPYQQYCQDLAAQLGVGGRIDWLGYIAREQLLDLYARAAVLVVPSTYEGFGYAAAQALCAGLPLLVSNVSSLPEVVQGEAATLAPDDTAAWAAHLRTMVEERLFGQQRADAVRHGAVGRFGWRASISRMISVYEAALA